MNWREFAMAGGVLAVCTLMGLVAQRVLSPVNLTMIYVAGVVFIASRASARAAAAASILAALLFDFLFTEPRYSVTIAHSENVVACVVLLVTSLFISGLTQRVRRQTQAARDRAENRPAGGACFWFTIPHSSIEPPVPLRE